MLLLYSYYCKKLSIVSYFCEIIHVLKGLPAKINMGMKIMNKFSERLKEMRLEKEIVQIALAKQLGVSKGIISLW